MVRQQARVVDLDCQQRRHRSSPAARQRQGSIAVVVAGRPLRRLPVDARSGRERAATPPARSSGCCRMAGGGEATKLSDQKTAIRAVQVVRRQQRASSSPPRNRRPTLKEARKNSRRRHLRRRRSEWPGASTFSNLWVITVADKQGAATDQRRSHRRRLRSRRLTASASPTPAARTTSAISRTWPKCSSSTSSAAPSTQLTTQSGAGKQRRVGARRQGGHLCRTARQDLGARPGQSLHSSARRRRQSDDSVGEVPGRHRPLLLASVGTVDRDERDDARPRRRVRARPARPAAARPSPPATSVCRSRRRPRT